MVLYVFNVLKFGVAALLYFVASDLRAFATDAMCSVKLVNVICVLFCLVSLSDDVLYLKIVNMVCLVLKVLKFLLNEVKDASTFAFFVAY